MSRTDLQIPLFVKPVASLPAQQVGERGLEIPLWIKPSCLGSIERYAAVPMHQAEISKRLARQRELNKCKDEDTAGRAVGANVEENNSDGSTEYEDCSEVSSVAYESDIAEEISDDSSEYEDISEVSSVAAVELPDSDKMKELVAALRDARARASARRAQFTIATVCITKEAQ